MPSAANVIALPRTPVRRMPRAYIDIDGENAVHYGIDGVTQTDAIRLHKAALELAAWLREIAEHG
jgi:hypothetical protein